MPQVSVIIPAHNPGPYLREAILSVQAQTFADWDLTVVDDNSTQDLSWISREFPAVRYIRQPHGGASIARNNGVLNTTGEFIAFMDQDDLWQPRKLERQVAALTQLPDAALCHCDLAVVDAFGKLKDGGADSYHNAVAPQVVLDGSAGAPARADGKSKMHASAIYFSTHFVVPSTTLIRRAALATSGLLDPFIPFSGDYDLIIKLGSRYQIAYVPAVDTLYRKHENNFSDRYDVGRGEVKALIARYQAYAKSKGDHLLERDVKRIFGRPRKLFSAQAYDCARRSLRQRQFKTAAYHMRRAFVFSPWFVMMLAAHYVVTRFSSRSTASAQ